MTFLTTAPPLLRRLSRALALASSLVLLVGGVLAGVHTHQHTSTSRACAICSLGHTPATTSVVGCGGLPTPRVERVMVERTLTPRGTVVVTATGRAPPTA